MLNYDRYQAILAESDAATRQAAEVAFVKLLEKIRAGDSPQAALKAVLKEFNANAIAGFAEALNAILESSLGVKEIAAYKVGRVKLSDALYANAKTVAANTQQIIEKHLQGLHNAQELRKALYEGYSFQDDPLHVVKPLPKYLQVEFDKFKAAALKTPALRAAYLEAIRKKEAGAGMDELEKALRVAFYERNRYFANRIARTELHRNYTDKVAKELMEEEQIEYVQIRLSAKHPRTDVCDLHARLDAYGLGPGVYPKADAPKPPFHPHCLPGDALITASGRITAVSKRWYDGNMAVITTASGQKLAATVNHPVLTPSGWIAIGALQVGQQVVCRFSNERPSFADIQHQDVPTRIADIADTFFSSRQVTAREVPTSTPDFHGDGMAGQIAVIGADSQLWDRFDAASDQSIMNRLLVLTRNAKTLFGKCLLDFERSGLWFATNGIVRCFHPFLFEFWRGLIHLELLRLAHRAQRYIVALQVMSDRQSTDANRFGQSQNGFSGLVFGDQLLADFLSDLSKLHPGQHPYLPIGTQTDSRIDQSTTQSFSRYSNLDSDFLNGSVGKIALDAIVNINTFRFRGHVYNLETEQGHYTSNNIITHNCYCLVSPKIDIFNAKPRFNPKAGRAFLAKLPPKEARDIAGSWDKLARVKGGETLEAIYNEGKDPLYQWKRVGDFSPSPITKIKPAPPVHPAPPISYWQTGTPEGDWHEASFNDAPIWLKQAIQREGTLPKGVQHTKGKSAYHQAISDQYQYIEMGDERPNGTNAAHHQASWRHEYGHALDYKLGKKAGRMDQKDKTTWKLLSYESESPEFTKAMKADSRTLISPPGMPPLSKTDEWKKAKLAMMEAKSNEIKAIWDLPDAEQGAMLDNMAMSMGTNYSDVKAALVKHCAFPGDVDSAMIHVLSALKYRDAQGLLDALEVGGGKAAYDKGILGMVSDLFSAATNKKIEGCGSHPASYYKEEPSKRNKECFANLTSMIGDGNPFWVVVAERMCPNMTKAFYKALR